MHLDHRRHDVYGVRQVWDRRNASDCDNNTGATIWVASAVNNGATPDYRENFLGILRYLSQEKAVQLASHCYNCLLGYLEWPTNRFADAIILSSH